MKKLKRLSTLIGHANPSEFQSSNNGIEPQQATVFIAKGSGYFMTAFLYFAIESLDVTRIFSEADQLPAGTPLIKNRPIRSLRHTISQTGLVGRGNIPKPGEISLVHRGVLFLDEFPEFGTRVLEVMRQPMEDKVVTISRAKGLLTFPANFQLIATMNPCSCGWLNDAQKACGCTPAVVTKYQKRISGPLLDCIDIHIEVPRVDY